MVLLKPNLSFEAKGRVKAWRKAREKKSRAYCQAEDASALCLRIFLC